MRVTWGTDDRKTLTGAGLYVTIFQVSSLLPLPYLFAVVGYPVVITSRNVLSFLFDVGMMSLPRVEALALSYAYTTLSSELVVYFTLLVVALVVGLVVGHLLREGGETALRLRQVLAALLAFDLVLRLLPFGFNLTFGLPAAVIGWLCRAACLAFVVLDLRAAKEG
ncbi:MAG: hypothetical protein IKG69_10635 [Atopobiaceae bacterium]|nr:hypothetical protein [Atopobiaceae bacterium]